jgi:uncharacterized BrkB/YihY/UPF0761 family membrane protein
MRIRGGPRALSAAHSYGKEEAVSGLDLFAWIVLVILLVTLVVVFCLLGALPGHIARSRGHPWADAVRVAGWVTLIFGFALWPVALIWAYVDVPAPRTREQRP